MGKKAEKPQPQEVVTKPVVEGTPQTELLREGAALVKLENDVQMQIAISRPRNEAKILKSSLAELDIYPSCAEEALYRKPVGRDDSGQMKFAEGLSIRAAESLANRWDNSGYAAQIISEDDSSAVLAAVFLDYENNTRHCFQKRVSKFYKTRQGQVRQYAPDRFDLVVAANQSKALREAILRSLPAGLKREYEKKVRTLLKQEDLPKRLKKMKAAFKKLGVSEEQLEKLQDKKIDDFNHEDLTGLLAIFNTINDGEITVESVFGNKQKEPEKKSSLKVKTAEKPKRYKCTASEDFCGIEIEESELVYVNGRPSCPECQNEVKEIKE